MDVLWSSPVYMYLTKGMDAASLRQRIHSHNLANVNTPHFKRSYVEFESLLQKAGGQGKKVVATTNPRHIGSGAAAVPSSRVVRDEATSMRTDGNNVDVDKEMTQIAMNQLYYNALSQQLNERLGIMRYVINEGRR